MGAATLGGPEPAAIGAMLHEDAPPREPVARGIMKGATLDDFTDLSGWSPVASGQARLDISGDRGLRGGAMRLDFDYRGGGGFVVARKRFSFSLPDVYAFSFDVRGMAPANKLEFKLVDPDGHNVWRYQEEAFAFPADWRSVRIRSSQIDFAWGPAGGGPVRQVGAIELAIVAPPGGMGTVWVTNLCLEDHSLRSIPAVQSSSALPGHEARCAVDGRAEDELAQRALRGAAMAPDRLRGAARIWRADRPLGRDDEGAAVRPRGLR